MFLQLDSIKKKFGDFYAVNGVSFGVEKGTIFGLLGPNGAGKTTTIRMIMGIFLPDEGRICVNGNIVGGGIKDLAGYLPEERGLYRKMKVVDLLIFFARSHGLNTEEAKKRTNYWLSRMELGGWGKKKIEELSKGMQQKIQFIATILHDPPILIMDELFSGLDPINTGLLKDILLELNGKGTTVLFSTHNMEEAEKMCNSICLINQGKVVVTGELSAVKKSCGKNTIVVESASDLAPLRQLDYLEQIDMYENYAEMRLKEGAKPSRLLQDIVGRLDIRKFEVVEPTLRNIFVDLIKGGNHER